MGIYYDNIFELNEKNHVLRNLIMKLLLHLSHINLN